MPSPKAFDLTKGSLPLVVAFGLFLTVGGACIKIGETIAQYKHRDNEITHLSRKLDDLARQVTGLRLDDRWARSDQVLFCWEAERINAGWRCPTLRPAVDLGSTPKELQRP